MVKNNQKRAITRTRKRGARSKKTPQVMAGICEAIRRGMPFERAAQLNGISRSTLLKWRNEDAEFSRLVDEACAVSEVLLLEAIQEKTSEDWRAAAWILQKRFPERYADRRELEVNVGKSDGRDEVIAMMEQTKELYLGSQKLTTDSEEPADSQENKGRTEKVLGHDTAEASK